MWTEAKARTNSEWVRELRAGGEEQAAALGALRAYLVGAARYGLHRSRWRLAHNALGLDQLAEDCAQDALLAILGRLPEFRGDSRFTTWVQVRDQHGAERCAPRISKGEEAVTEHRPDPIAGGACHGSPSGPEAENVSRGSKFPPGYGAVRAGRS